jgi:hypothetical protein
MVAGRRLWGCNEERSAQNQACGSGDLSVEAVVEHRLGAGEARGLRTYIETVRKIDQQDYGEAEQAEGEDNPAQPTTTFVTHRRERQGGGEDGDRDQEEGVGFAGALDTDGWGACGRETGIAGLADLYRPIIDELGCDQANSRADDGQTDSPLRRQHSTAPSRRPPGQGRNA